MLQTFSCTICFGGLPFILLVNRKVGCKNLSLVVTVTYLYNNMLFLDSGTVEMKETKINLTTKNSVMKLVLIPLEEKLVNYPGLPDRVMDTFPGKGAFTFYVYKKEGGMRFSKCLRKSIGFIGVKKSQNIVYVECESPLKLFLLRQTNSLLA